MKLYRLVGLLYFTTLSRVANTISRYSAHIFLQISHALRLFSRGFPTKLPGGSGDNNGLYQVSIGNKKTESKNSRSGVNMIMKRA